MLDDTVAGFFQRFTLNLAIWALPFDTLESSKMLCVCVCVCVCDWCLCSLISFEGKIAGKRSAILTLVPRIAHQIAAAGH